MRGLTNAKADIEVIMKVQALLDYFREKQTADFIHINKDSPARREHNRASELVQWGKESSAARGRGTHSPVTIARNGGEPRSEMRRLPSVVGVHHCEFSATCSSLKNQTSPPRVVLFDPSNPQAACLMPAA